MSAKRNAALSATVRQLERARLDVAEASEAGPDADLEASERAAPHHRFWVKVRAQSPRQKYHDQGLEQPDFDSYWRLQESSGRPLLLVVLSSDGDPRGAWLSELGAYQRERTFKPSKRYEGLGRVPIFYWPQSHFQELGALARQWRADGHQVRSASLLDPPIAEPEPERERQRLEAGRRIRSEASRRRQLVNTKEAAYRLGVTAGHVATLFRRGDLEGEQSGPGGLIMIRKGSIDDYLRYDPHWRRAYRETLRSARFNDLACQLAKEQEGRCIRCEQPARDLQTHHWHYRTLGHETLSDLALACPACHAILDAERAASQANGGASLHALSRHA